jgi:hypothetical protein
MNILKILFLSTLISIGLTNLCNSQLPTLVDNFPVVLDTGGSYAQSFGSVPIIADLAKNGENEIITTTDYAVYVVKSDGTFAQGFPLVHSGYILDFAVGDVNNDGSLDIVLRTPESIDAIDRSGASLPGFPVDVPYGSNVGTASISLYDLDNNGKLGIIAVSYDPYIKFGGVTIINSDGTTRPGWPKYSNFWYSSPAIGDIDGNGMVDVILTGDKQMTVYPYYDSACVAIYKSDGTLFSYNWPFYMDLNYILTGAGAPSVYINRYYPDYSFICVSSCKVFGEHGMMFGKTRDIYRNLGNVRNQFGIFSHKDEIEDGYNYKIYKLGIYGDIKSSNSSLYLNDDLGTLCMGDVNNDGTVEFVAGTQLSRELCVFDNNLNLMTGWPRNGIGCWWASPLIGKVKSGNTLDILSIKWSANSVYGVGGFYAYDFSGNPLSWSPFRSYGLVNAASLGSLKNDGNSQIIITANQRGKIFLHAITIPGIPFTHSNFPWPMLAHDRYHTNQYGFIPPDEPIGIKPISKEIPTSFKLYQNYPNPFNPQTTIKFDIAKTNSVVKLVIYDVLGRNITTLINQNLVEGRYSVTWDASQYSSGIYFSSLFVNNHLLKTNKLILLK